jgi:hypothetical protein
MKRIDFDYVAGGATLGRQVFALGILCVALAIFEYLKVTDEASEWDEVAVKSAIPVKNKNSGAEGDKSRQRQEIEDAQAVIRRLSLPWGELLLAMESAAFDDVALLTIQPDVQQGSLSLAGEAKAYGDILTYMHRLERSGVLSNVRLLSHELRRTDPQQPVAFALASRWRMQP